MYSYLSMRVKVYTIWACSDELNYLRLIFTLIFLLVKCKGKIVLMIRDSQSGSHGAIWMGGGYLLRKTS